MVGGIARTEVRDGYRFDLGGHRFFTKVKEVDDLWHEIMKEEFLKRPRQSRIYWNDKFLEYPLQGMDVIKKLGPVELVALRPLLPVGGDQAQGPRGDLRAVGLEPLRQAAVQPLLQDLHREAVGRLDRRDPRRVGGAADQGPVVLQRRQVGLLRQQGQQDQVADLRVQLPALRPGPDVGADDRRHPRAGRRGPPERAGDPAARSLPTARVTEVVAGGETLTPSHVISSLPLRTTVGIAEPEAPGRRARRRARPALPRLPHRRARDRRRGPVPRQLDLHPRAGRAASAASRTSAPGARGWCPTTPTPRSAWSTSASRATSCGTWPTTTSSRSPAREIQQLGLARAEQGQVRLRRRACTRPTRSTTPSTPSAWRRSAAGSTGSRTCSRSGATACTATTTPTTRC